MSDDTAPAAKRRRRWWLIAVVLAAWAPLVCILILVCIDAIECALFGGAVNAVRKAATARRIRDFGGPLENFKSDWGIYPPSVPEPAEGRQYGYQNLAYYLTGPTGQGWGKAIGGRTPFGGQAPGRTYGPYYTIDPSNRMPVGTAPGVCDAYPSPRRPILYFRYHADRDPPCDVRDNPVDPTCQTGFASQAHFELSATYVTPDSRLRWQRDDYLLISAGRDRLFGYVVEDETTGEVRPARNREEIRSGAATCDDIGNF